MQKYRRLVVALVIPILIFGYIFLIQRDGVSEVVILEESYLNDFIVESDTVQINCVISIKNRSDTDKTIKIIGDFADEIDTGLLTERELTGIFVDKNTNAITIPANSSLKNISVVFYGEYGGTEKMKDRNLPDIEIIEV